MEHLEVITPPAIEPVTLDEAKKHLRVDIDDDDDFISSLISAARVIAEALLRQTLIATTYDWYLDEFPASANGYYNRLVRQMGPGPNWLPNGAAILYLPKPPLVSVASVKYYDSTGTLETVDPSRYAVSTGIGSRIQPVVGNVWPVVRPQIDGVVIRYTAGLADASAVPANVKAAMKLLLGNWYENRESTVIGTIVNELPDGVTALLSATDHGAYA